ncbi:putative membrane protein YkoI [Streptomyces sp. V4I23]|uniref:PepSY domain-containing protein n=1 Tax=Streptomyces sp. V4I23 TaxID=3042282 RepID=UPI00277E4049|nr:PepSY domain-containing protein [Streptomyces sp. V4I23]MDQ1008248.1 putative membrane protein YkoI [Streptomyces sp. V4I23]
MKRNLVIATVAAAVLVGGGAYTAVAVSADDSPSASAPASRSVQNRNDDRDDDRAERPAGGFGAAEAVAAALKHTPGTVASVDLDDDGAGHWEVEVVGRDDDREHELKVDARTGAVRADDRNDDDRDDRDDDRAALRAASVDAREALEAALRSHPGATVTSVDFDDDGGDHWEVELHEGKGSDDEAEVMVDARTGDVSREKAAADDDGADD